MIRTTVSIRARYRLSGSLWLLLAFHLQAADAIPVTVTITQRSPISTLAADGSISSMTEGTVGNHYTFVSSDGQQMIVQDAQGTHYRIAQASTDYVGAAPATPAPTATAASTTSTPIPSPVAPTNAAPTPAPTATASTADATTSNSSAVTEDDVAKINTGMGKPFFSTQNFWKESALLIANRIGLKLEDKTKWETAYRRYYYGREGGYDPAPILGGNAYCVALYVDANDVPTSALIAFTNDGDYKGIDVILSKIFRLQHAATPPADADKQLAALQDQANAMENAFEKDRSAEQDTLTKNLTTLFGDPKRTSFGSNAVSREDALRWDWNGVSLLLTCVENKYNLLRLIPTELADNHGRTERIPRDEMSQKLSDAVEHRPNGDIVITQLPMADQGLKGYCVPATWERVLRYTGVPGDMYSLSRIGGAGFGGGESGGNVAKQLDDVLHDYGRRAEFVDIDTIDAHSLRHYIDQGIPVFWGVNPAGYAPSEERAAICDRDKDWDNWKKLLDQSRARTTKDPPPLGYDGGHQVLIIGYNPDTKEIAWSDPWGRNTQERWMTQEEAARCSLRQYYIITF
jgi:hypothetical protein